ncbi:hypothetical protein BDU57DRAFT_579101 [Ampelomyces quisqualis]|uniref:Uncharacterized protein n=1 Tax=Ampelomyces quisqualis TaxID=50730 RepID=A0A6A5QGK3_AMPQU|nr:hypothetical protein BDU57DRAFT_579101 [Ampelomyces quisqualis]
MADEIDPTEFVQRIRQLGEQRDQQDAARVKRLEEELIQGRSERLARRAERARSLSPDKPFSPPSPRSAAGTPRSMQEPAAARDDTAPRKPAASAAALGRSGTLSWNQRPQSGSLRRPLSVASRSPERGGNSSPTKTPEPAEPAPNPARSSPAAPDDAESAATTRSPLPMLDSQKFAPPLDQPPPPDAADSAARALAMSPAQGRISPDRDRPASPTKGMGGFVQSAMLKRSDSVSKRWSTQTPPTLTRQSSTLSSRASAVAGYATLSRVERPTTLSRDASIEPSSRPASSHSTATITRGLDPERTPNDDFVKPALPHHSRSKSVASSFHEKDQSHGETSPPSPSKRWSPTKSSWLESALNKPDSPKPKQPPPAQPAWMAEISRIKQQRSSIDLGKANAPPDASAEPFGSGRISPAKDVQLKPSSLRKFDASNKEASSEPDTIDRPLSPRKFDTPKKEVPKESGTLAEFSPKANPVLAPKPSLSNTDKPRSADNGVAPESEPAPQVDGSASVPETSVQPASKADVAEPAKLPGRLLPAAKSEPSTPPKKDFRAGLKPRQPMDDASKKSEVNEFQNVFGKLRKAETKNYVAPDTLKTNILTGKNALNVTGGPKPTVRRDEFRESLVKKKSAMILRAQDEGSTLKKTDGPPEQPPTPEAIAKRVVLGRADSGSKPALPEKPKASTPEALARKKSLRTMKPAIDDKPVQPVPLFGSKEPAKASKLAARFNPALAGMLARGPPPLATNKSTSSADGTESPVRAVQEEPRTGSAPELQHMTKGRARGPRRRAPAKQASTEPEKTTPEGVTVNVAAVPLVKPWHVLPSSVPSKTNGIPEELPVTKTLTRQSIVGKPATPAKPARISSGQFSKSTPEPLKTSASSGTENRAYGSQDTPKESPRPEPIASPPISSPAVPKKPASLDSDRRVSGSYSTPQKFVAPPTQSPKPSSPSPVSAPSQPRFPRPLPTTPAAATKSPVEIPKPTALKEIANPNIENPPSGDDTSPEKSTFASVKSATALWDRQPVSSSPLATRTKSPIKLPTKADEEAAMQDAGLVRSPETASNPQPTPAASSPVHTRPLPAKAKPTGLGFSLSSLGGYLPARSRESSPQISPGDVPVSPPVSGGRPQSEPLKVSAMPAKHDGMFAEFFDEVPVTDAQLPETIDTVQVLKSPPLDLGPAGKIRTLRKQIQEVTGEGKLSPIPMQEEHILFQDSMYLSTHIYGDSKGAKHTDVYLWAGNGVAEPTIEDVQLFVKNYAKQNQAKLVTIRQGQEPPNFFDALGGIVITRRGMKPAAKDFMLCGRRHLGHLAFDEVESSLKSLCSAFPYLVSTSTGKVYLWKGRGCSAEELSGARLMGMDLAPTGDFTEIDEGSEPQDFINSFPLPAVPTKGPAIPRSADHWRYKATSEKYRARLYRIEQTQGPSGWGQALQVSSSFFAPLLRRPSWNAQVAEQTPQTPVTPKTTGGATTTVKEIMPFSQRDLEPESIYVLDAFFEMYIIIGALSRTQSQAFSTALLFAQEYGILAVSEEDRPFMPVTTVVMEGVPRDMKAVFRHWDDTLIPAAGLMRGKLGRGKSLRIVGLDKAIEATRR